MICSRCPSQLLLGAVPTEEGHRCPLPCPSACWDGISLRAALSMPASAAISPERRAGAGRVHAARGRGLPGGGAGLGRSKTPGAQGLGLLTPGATSMCVTQCWTRPQLWGE